MRHDHVHGQFTDRHRDLQIYCYDKRPFLLTLIYIVDLSYVFLIKTLTSKTSDGKPLQVINVSKLGASLTRILPLTASLVSLYDWTTSTYHPRALLGYRMSMVGMNSKWLIHFYKLHM